MGVLEDERAVTDVFVVHGMCGKMAATVVKVASRIDISPIVETIITPSIVK